eukprot:TRINITY_DN7163_c0_g1_i1.p1 TRINITY_DN7163_c0_g1~~TRINITY_DN7163_c0_g1_i1.p1  ORF type:complete len:145 (-),score=34.44 TRINITY_DN7163_c0_g1_i1:196-570(-)
MAQSFDPLHKPLQTLAPRLEELSNDQTEWLNQLSAENTSLDSLSQELGAIEAIISKVPEYLNKIALLERDMIMIQNKSSSLKQRAQTLKTLRQSQLSKEADLKAVAASEAPVSEQVDYSEEVDY